MLTCYDATTARWLRRGGVDFLLVGDTAGHVILGHDDTIHAPLDFMLTLTAAVKRGAPEAFVVGDMPWMSYHADADAAIHNAARFLLEGRADAVKIEVDRRFVDLVARMDRANIPVVGHIGWTPQRTPRTGVPVIAGKTDRQVSDLATLAGELIEAGVVMLLIEQATDAAAAAVLEVARSADRTIPVIGCGAGPACDGQVVVLHDWLGLSDWQPSFVKPAANSGQALSDLAAKWKRVVEEGRHLEGGGVYH